MTISELPGDQPVQRLRRVEELLVRRVAGGRLHRGDRAAVVPGLGDGGADRGPVVVAQKQIRVDALIAGAPAMLQDVLQMNACDPRPMDLNPLFGKPRVVDVADIEMNPDYRTVDVVEELPELTRTDEKALLGVAILAADLYARARGPLTERLQGIDTALIDLVVRHFLGHEAGDHQDRVGAEQHGGLNLALHDASGSGAPRRIAARQRSSPTP